MPLRGQAKREYMKLYMQRRRAGLPTRTIVDEVPYFSFCVKPADQVHTMVAAHAPHDAYICDGCTERAADAVAERKGRWR